MVKQKPHSLRFLGITKRLDVINKAYEEKKMFTAVHFLLKKCHHI